VLDLHRPPSCPANGPFLWARYPAAIQYQRGDRNGELLNIRIEDLRSLAVIYDVTSEALVAQLIDWACPRAGRQRTGSSSRSGRGSLKNPSILVRTAPPLTSLGEPETRIP